MIALYWMQNLKVGDEFLVLSKDGTVIFEKKKNRSL